MNQIYIQAHHFEDSDSVYFVAIDNKKPFGNWFLKGYIPLELWNTYWRSSDAYAKVQGNTFHNADYKKMKAAENKILKILRELPV